MPSRFDFNTDYEAVAASQTNQVLGAVGARGDIIERLILSVTTSATSTVSIKDGADTAIVVVPNNVPVGVVVVEIGALSRTGAWQVTTGAGVSVLAVGHFT